MSLDQLEVVKISEHYVLIRHRTLRRQFRLRKMTNGSVEATRMKRVGDHILQFHVPEKMKQELILAAFPHWVP